jgi:hypothetical protein
MGPLWKTESTDCLSFAVSHVDSPGVSALDVTYMLPVLPWILRLIKHKTYSIFGESRFVLLVSFIRASVLLFMLSIAYVWLMDDSFPY